MIGILLKKLPKLIWWTIVGERATCCHVWQQHFFCWVKYFCGFCHKFYPGKNNNLFVCIFSFPRQIQAVSNIIRYLLDFLRLVVMGKDNSVFFLGQLLDFLL